MSQLACFVIIHTTMKYGGWMHQLRALALSLHFVQGHGDIEWLNIRQGRSKQWVEKI